MSTFLLNQADSNACTKEIMGLNSKRTFDWFYFITIRFSLQSERWFEMHTHKHTQIILKRREDENSDISVLEA